MARGLRGDRGGIASLRELIRQHKEAVEYHLITLGLRLAWLGTQALTWRDLLVITKQCPRGSALHRALAGEESAWGLQEQLLASVFDAAQMLVWMQSEDGAKGRNRPKPFPRPGVAADEDETHTGSGGVDLVDMAEWLAKRNPTQHRPASGTEPHTEEAR